jgi:hypothetical protein
MSTVLPVRLRRVVLRKVPPALCLLALTVILTGCGPESGEQLLPYMRSASLGPSGQLVTQPATDTRHHFKAAHFNPPHAHSSHL